MKLFRLCVVLCSVVVFIFKSSFLSVFMLLLFHTLCTILYVLYWSQSCYAVNLPHFMIIWIRPQIQANTRVFLRFSSSFLCFYSIQFNSIQLRQQFDEVSISYKKFSPEMFHIPDILHRLCGLFIFFTSF